METFSPILQTPPQFTPNGVCMQTHTRYPHLPPKTTQGLFPGKFGLLWGCPAGLLPEHLADARLESPPRSPQGCAPCRRPCRCPPVVSPLEPPVRPEGPPRSAPDADGRKEVPCGCPGAECTVCIFRRQGVRPEGNAWRATRKVSAIASRKPHGADLTGRHACGKSPSREGALLRLLRAICRSSVFMGPGLCGKPAAKSIVCQPACPLYLPHFSRRCLANSLLSPAFFSCFRFSRCIFL